MGLAESRQEAFWESCGFGHLDRARHLLEAGDIDVNWVSYTNECCPIHTASQGKKEIVELLIKHNCDVNVKDIRGNLPIHHAAMKGHVEIVEILLDAGSEIDVQEKNGWTALHNAAYWCRPEIVRLLIKRGCNVHLQNKDERTALLECTRSQAKDDKKLSEIALALAEAGSDVNTRSNCFGETDMTALMFAAFHNHPEVASVLIDAGCELDAITTTYWTAMHWAADRESDEIVYMLLDAGANPVKRCLKGETAYDRAKSEPVKEILATAIQLHKELHKIDSSGALTQLRKEREDKKIYKPICDPNFKSQSFLPSNWKPTSPENVKNLITEKKAKIVEELKQETNEEPANDTGTSTVHTDILKVSGKANGVDCQQGDSNGCPESTDTSMTSIGKPTSPVDAKTFIKEKRARLAAMTSQQYRNELAKRTGSSTVITDADKVSEKREDNDSDAQKVETELSDLTSATNCDEMEEQNTDWNASEKLSASSETGSPGESIQSLDCAGCETGCVPLGEPQADIASEVTTVTISQTEDSQDESQVEDSVPGPVEKQTDVADINTLSENTLKDITGQIESELKQEDDNVRDDGEIVAANEKSSMECLKKTDY